MANLKDTIVLGNLTVTGRITGAVDSSGGSGISVVNNNPSLSWGAQSTVATIGSTSITLTMPSNPVAGTAGTIPKFTGTNTIGNSSLTIGEQNSLQINSGGSTLRIGNLNGAGANDWIHMYTDGSAAQGIITDTTFSSTNGVLGTTGYPWKGLILNGGIYTTTDNTNNIGDPTHYFNTGYIKKISATTINLPTNATRMTLGPEVSVGKAHSICLFGGTSGIDYSSMIISKIAVAASTWTSVAAAGNCGTVLVLGACWIGPSSGGGFIALATKDKLHLSYKYGGVTNVQVSGNNVQVYTSSAYSSMRVMCLKVYE